MAKKNEGAFTPMREQPLNNWLWDLAKARAEDEGIDIGAALGKVKSENPPLAEAARTEVTGGASGDHGPKLLQLMRRALEIAKARGMSVEPAMERAAAENPDLAAAARMERGGRLYAGELRPLPGVGDRMVLNELGVDAALDPGAHLVMLAEDRSRERNISFREALALVANEHAQLARASREQSLGRRSP